MIFGWTPICPGDPPNAYCTMTDLVQPHILLQDNAHDPQHYLYTYFIHPNLCHWPPALSPSHFMPHSSILSSILFHRPADLFIRCYTMHFSDWVIHRSYIYQSTLLHKCCCIIVFLSDFLKLRGKLCDLSGNCQ